MIGPGSAAGATVMSEFAASTGTTSSGGFSHQSASPPLRAATFVMASGILSHSTRSTLATLPPEAQLGGLAAWNVLGIYCVDHLMSGLKLFFDEFERTRADHFGDLLEWVGIGEPFRHHEQCQARHLAERVEHQ